MCAWFSLRLASSVKGVQGHKDERKRLIETTAQQRNESKTSSSMSVVSILYTRGYFAALDPCRSVFFVRWTLVRRKQYCEWSSASAFTDSRERLFSVQDARRTLCQRRTVNRALDGITIVHMRIGVF